MNDSSSASNRLMMDRARSAVLSRDFTLAARLYKNLLKEDPSNKELLSALGDLYQRSGNDSQAIPLYNQIVEENPNDVVALNNLGSIYRRLRRYDDSIAVLEKAVIADESNVQTFYNLGFTYKLMGKNERAIQCFSTVVEENPNDVLAYNHLGAIYAAEREYDKSISSYQRGLKVDPNHPILHLNLAQCYEKVGSLDLAVNEYEAALRSKPGWREATDGYVDLLVRKNDIASALELINQAIRLNPQDAEMHAKLGDVYALITDFDSAEAEYNAALKCNPAGTHALSALTYVYDLHGNHADAVKIMARYAEVRHDDSAMLKRRALVMMGAGKLREAASSVKTLWDRDSDDVEMLSLLAQYYILHGEESKAEGCLKKSRRLDSEYIDYFRDYAKRYRQLKKYDRAVRNLEIYLREKEFDSETLYLLAKCYEETKQYEKALYAYRKISDHFGMDSVYEAAEERLQKLMDLDGADRHEKEPDFEGLENSMQEGLGLERELVEEQGAEVPEADDNIEPVIEFEPMDSERISEAKNKMNWGDRGYTFEKLTQEDSSGGSPFDRHLDDDIFASNSANAELDSLVPAAGKEDEDFEERFFDGNPFGGRVPRKAPEEDLMDENFLDEDIEGTKRRKNDAVTQLTDGTEPPVQNVPAAPAQSAGIPAGSRAEDFAPASDFGRRDFAEQNPLSSPSQAAPRTDAEPRPDSGSVFEADTEELEPGQDYALARDLTEDDGFFADAEGRGVQGTVFEPETVQENYEAGTDDVQIQDEGLLEEDESRSDDILFVPETIDADGAEENSVLDYGAEKEDMPDRSFDESEIEFADEEPVFESEAIEVEEEVPSVESVMEEAAQEIEDAASREDDIQIEEAAAEELPAGDSFDGEAVTDDESVEEGFEEEELTVDNAAEDESAQDEFAEELPAEEALAEEALAEESAGEEPAVEPDANDAVGGGYRLSADLFIKLRALSEYLPVDKKLEFQESRECLLLDYIIRRLSGEEGLLHAAQEVRDSLHMPDSDSGSVSLEQTAGVLSDMKSYLSSLPDRKLARSLQDAMDGAIDRLTAV